MSRPSYRPGLSRCETSGKICYPSQAKARKKARRIKGDKDPQARDNSAGKSLRVYLCRSCSSWHLTSQEKIK